jgi:TfoX/Sxy family transcriptional regulator of competence genes
MPYDPKLVDTLRKLVPLVELHQDESITEMKMFGGICFCLNRKMLAGVEKDRIVVRISDSDYRLGLERGLVHPMDLTGKPMRNFAFLDQKAAIDSDQLMSRIRASAEYVRTHMLGSVRGE